MIQVYRTQELDTGLFTEFVTWIDRSEMTTRSYTTNLRQFIAWLNYSEISAPTRADIIKYRAWLMTEHEAISLDPLQGWKYRTDQSGEPIRIKCKADTVTAYIRSVCQFFKWTAANGYYPDIAAQIHAPKVRHDTHKKEALTAAEVMTIADSIQRRAAAKTEAVSGKDAAGRIERGTEQGKRLYAIYLLAVNAGLRTVEISRANIKDLETKNGQTWIYIQGKGHAEADQKKALSAEVSAAIRDYLSCRSDHSSGNSPLFTATGNRSGGKRLAATTISTMLKRAMQDAGFNSERLTAHSLRHTAGTAVQTITGDIYATQKYMRHSNPATTEIYLHNDTEQQDAKTAEALSRFYHGSESDRAELDRAISGLNDQQLKQLAELVKAIA